MAGRTIAIGDVHGELAALQTLFARLPELDAGDTYVFLGDYIDRGPDSAAVVDFVRTLPRRTTARVVALRGNHEDAWVRIRRKGWGEFLFPVKNGCLATLRSFTGGPPPARDESPQKDDYLAMERGAFIPDDVFEWLESLPAWYEDDHAIYVHAGLPQREGRWLHPSEVENPEPLLWQRSRAFFETYEGKRVVFGHTSVAYLPQEHSTHTPHDNADSFLRGDVIGVDTGCGRPGGFLSAVELPAVVFHESR